MDNEALIVDEWLAQIGASPKTKQLYKLSLEKFIKYAGKTSTALIEEAEDEVMRGLLMRKRSIRKYLIGFKEHLKTEGNSPKSINTYMAAVKSFYKTNEIDLPNLKDKAALPLEENGSRSQLNIEDIKKLINHCKSLRSKAIIYTILSSGLGGNEIRNLKIRHLKNVDKNNIATLQLTRQKVNYEFTTFLSPEAMDAINEYLEFRNKNPKLAVKGPEDWVFVIEDGSQFSEVAFLRTFRDIGKEAGFGNGHGLYNFARAHNLRKFFNSQLLNNGADIFFVDYLMGHKIDPMHETYFKSDPKKLKERYMKYLPFLTIERTEPRVLESEAYNRLQAENAQLRLELEKMGQRMDEITKNLDLQKDIDRSLSSELEKRMEELIEKRAAEILEQKLKALAGSPK